MEQNDSDDNGATAKILWFIGGAAVGAAVALLYAPLSGAEARRRISRKTFEGRDAIAESGREVYERGRELYERGREIVDEAAEMFERGRQLMEDAPGD